MPSLLLAIDQGTTGSQVSFHDADSLATLARAKSEFRQIFPEPGWVEHAPADIWESVARAYASAREELGRTRPALARESVVAIGLTNQRETCVAWDVRTGESPRNAIVWQDRRTAQACARLKADPKNAAALRERTGLVCDPYFSATKMQWMLENDDGVKRLAREGNLALGTVDAWLLWKLTRGTAFVTDHTNASRTLLYGLDRGDWDDELCARFGVPKSALPRVVDSVGPLGVTKGFLDLPDGTPITGCLGDQQAALFGQDCESPGEAKITYGTGAFLLMHTGTKPVRSDDGLLATVACSRGGVRTFAREGAAFVAGAAVQFARDNLGWISRSSEIEQKAVSCERDPGLVFVPALAGLPAPWWNPDARGVLFGLTRGTTREQIMRAILESVALQNTVLLGLMSASAGVPLGRVGVNGGAALNDFLMQFQADVLRTTLRRPGDVETTSRGAVKAARLGLGETTPAAPDDRSRDFSPRMAPELAERINSAWQKAARAVNEFYS
jgi:glycerol kinase